MFRVSSHGVRMVDRLFLKLIVIKMTGGLKGIPIFILITVNALTGFSIKQGCYGSGEYIEFSYKLTRLNEKSPGLVRVDCSLLNNTLDTIYFLSTSCNGYKYSLRFNEQEFELYEMIRCRYSETSVQELIPGEPLRFVCYLQEIKRKEKTRLGFDLYTIDSKNHFSDSINYPIFNRMVEEQEVIWGDSVGIEDL